MDRTAIIPSDMQTYNDDWKMSPGLACGDFVFLTGFTGADPTGHMSSDPEAQMRNAFAKVERVLAEAGLDFGSVVEMTTYHVGLREHLQLFKDIRSEFVREPYPAWTAIEVAGFVHEDAIVEVRVIASRQK
ncbi:RidA family protein [Roseibium sp. MMSF_3412]|uniref:RidA family protein n=1 Tax=Roseibium sp. MMSF_3412 TaxID=3046712 RepID=UPI00273DAE6E|nr:RidA family protein [Roseibium sp. MMSF_3412]